MNANSVEMTEAQRALVLEGLPELEEVIRRLAFRWRRLVPKEDTRAAAHDGLLLAARTYEPERGSFRVFARFCMEGAVFNLLRERDRHHRLDHAVRGAARRSAALLMDRVPSNEVLDEPTSDTARLKAVALTHAAIMLVRLAEEARAAQGEDATVETLTRGRLLSALDDALGDLPTRQRAVIEGHYGEERALLDVAADLGLTRSTIKREHTRALEALRKGLAARGILGGIDANE